MKFDNLFLLFMLVGLSKQSFSDAQQKEIGEDMEGEITSDRVSELEGTVYRQQEQIEKQQKEIDDLRSYVERYLNAQARELSYILEDMEVLKEEMNNQSGASTRDDEVNDIKTDIAEIKYRTTSCNESVEHLENEVTVVLGKLKTTVEVSSTLQAHVMNFKETLNTHTDEAEIFREGVQDSLKSLGEDIETVKHSLVDVEIRVEENENTIENQNQTLYEAIIIETQKVGAIEGKLDVVELSFAENLNSTRDSLLKHQERSEALQKQTDKRLATLATDINVQSLGIETLANSLLNQIAHLNSSLRMVNATLYQNQNEIKYMNDKILASENYSLEASENNRLEVEKLYEVVNSTQEQVANMAVFIETSDSVPDDEGLETKVKNLENLVDALNLKTEGLTNNILERIENNKKIILEAIQENIKNELNNQIVSKLEEFNNNITLIEGVLEGLTKQLGGNTERLDTIEFKVLQFERNLVICRIEIGNLSSLIRDYAEDASRDWSSMLLVKEELRMLETSIQDLPGLKTQMQQQGITLNELRSQIIGQQTEPPRTTTFVPPYRRFDFGIFNNNPSQHISRNNGINPFRPNGRQNQQVRNTFQRARFPDI